MKEIKIMNYHWKLKGLAKKVNPLQAAGELSRIQVKYGILTPEVIVKESVLKDAVLHPCFEWDDTKAAEGFRLQQARLILNNIQITVISDNETRAISAYEVVSVKEGYKSIDSFTTEDIEYIRRTVLADLNILKKKLQTYREFDEILRYINEAIATI